MVRIQLDLPEDQVAELDKLMEETRLSTRKDLFNNALTLFMWAVKAKKAGRTIASVDDDQRVRELVMPHLRDSYDDLLEAVRGADLLVSHVITYAARLVAEKTLSRT